ncbi:DoxX family protein [Kitasatospora sp. NPDC058965]|uniref:DoxX family protein n=1 Tax=Kitasatospora sp. NPDC058965 TaxID=3346682 RepID=UPI0036AE06AA
MSTAFVVASSIAAALSAFSAASVFARAAYVVEPLTAYGVPLSWLPYLGAAKAAGAIGLVVGLFVPALWVAAAIGLVLYYAGAVATVVRARSYAHIPFPLVYLAPVLVALGLSSAF